MNRVPSIHLTEPQLIEVLEEVFPEKGPLKVLYRDWAKMILEKAKSKSITSRSIYVSNEKLKKKTERLGKSDRSDTGFFAETLVLIRQKLKHRGIKLTKPGETDWLVLKELTALANEFCNEFQINRKEGYKEYISIALSKMKKFSLNKFKPMHPSILNVFEAKLELQSDKTPDDTNLAYKTYTTIINNRIGHTFDDYKENPEKYVCFKKAKDQAVSMKLKVPHYITAQFEALEWANGIPDPYQLYGASAMERARKYCYAHNISLSEKSIVNFSKIKKDATDKNSGK